MKHKTEIRYLPFDGNLLCTVVSRPAEGDKFPVILYRCPYEKATVDMTDEELILRVENEFSRFVDAGYAFFFQQCRGSGKSTGDCVPFIFEREEGLALQKYVRESELYGGELYLLGGSYTSLVHLVTAPFADDIKGASLESMDSERYGMFYRNGFFKINLIGGWHTSVYKQNAGLTIDWSPEQYLKKPLTEFTRRVYGERVENYDDALENPDRSAPFWSTKEGGSDSRNAERDTRVPMLLTVGTFDTFTHGVLKTWENMTPRARSISALIVHPYHHGGTAEEQPYCFENGELGQGFPDFDLRWLNYTRGVGKPPVPPGSVTYYELFGRGWTTGDALFKADRTIAYPLGKGEKTYTYDPEKPTRFEGGLTHNFGGTKFMAQPGREGVVTVFTDPLPAGARVGGGMKLILRVASDCEDTCFYVRVGITKKEGDFSLRDDIDQLSNHFPDYVPGTPVDLEFDLDPIALRTGEGERLRVDIASSAFPLFVPHTNTREPFFTARETRVARNTVFLDGCSLTVGFN